LKVISQGSESVNQVALTFDDGPNNKYTPQILEILNQYNVKGTFFVLGEQVRQHPEVLRRVADEGHEIGNHSFSHAQFNRSSEAKVREELVSTQDAIRAVLGYVPKLMRPPYGAYRDSNLALFEELGLSVVLWSVDTYDWKRKGEAIIRTVDRQTKNGSIILLHDRKSETVRVLPQIIEGLRSRGYKLVTVSELTGMPAYDYGAPVARGDGGEEPKS
jgi:peptidoglycan-N-acetylglucosamine deacetylase